MGVDGDEIRNHDCAAGVDFLQAGGDFGPDGGDLAIEGSEIRDGGRGGRPVMDQAASDDDVGVRVMLFIAYVLGLTVRSKRGDIHMGRGQR